MRPRRAFAALLVICGALATGCGGDAGEKNAYVDEVQAAQRSYVGAFERVLSGLTPTSTAQQDVVTLGRFDEETSRFATALEQVDPPEDVRAQHRALTAAVAGFRRRLQDAESRLRGGSADARAEVRTELSSSLADSQRALAEAVNDINTALRD